jgi:hypothetical protein
MPLHPSVREEFVDSGFRQFDRESLQDVEYSKTASEFVSLAYLALNKRPKFRGHAPSDVGYRPAIPPEIVLPNYADPLDAVRWLGKAVVTDDYSKEDFAALDTTRSLASNRATDRAVGRLKDFASDHPLGFVFLIKDRERSQAQIDRLERIRETLHRKLVLPTMNILVLPFSEVETHYEERAEATINSQLSRD